MLPPSVPPGWNHNPSSFKARMPVLAFALIGFGIAVYLGLYQLGVVAAVWEPFFGDGSEVILKTSSISHLLPIPDALLGACVYLAEFAVNASGGTTRWRTHPWLVILGGLIALALGCAGIALAISQPVLFHAYCTLCLASAACSISIACLAIAEVRATLRSLKHHPAALTR